VHTGDGTPDLSCTVQLRESGLVLPRVPVAVGVLGFAAPPAEGDLVLVVFAGEDLHAPVVAGRVYDEKVAPPASAPGELVAWLPHAQTEDTKRLELTVRTPEDGTRSATVKLAGDVAVEVTVADQKVTVTVGDAMVRLSQSSSSDGKAEVIVGDAKLTLDQSGDITVTASQKLRLEADTIELSATSKVKVTGQTIELN